MTFQQAKTVNGARLRKRPDLPLYYYHSNFCHMLSFVDARYIHVFEPEHVDFLSGFESLSRSAQCLYVRIAGRKGHVFDTRKFSYPEIADLPGAVLELGQTGFTAPVTQRDYHACLSAMTKPELLSFMSAHLSASAYKRSWKKDALVETAAQHIPFGTAALPPHFITQNRREALRYLSYLHFGRIEENLQSFTLRDLGLRKAPDFKSDYAARFDTLPEAKAAYFYADALHKFRAGTDAQVANIIDCADAWPQPQCDIARSARDRLLNKLGGLSERLGDLPTALALYGRSDDPLCNERVIRLRYQNGDKDWCKTRLENLIENPGSDDEHNFAEDFYARKFKKKRTSQVTDILRQSEVLNVDEAFKNQAERAAQRYYRAQGYDAFFTENRLWRTLFGLLFWEELYCAKDAALHSSFEKMPASLKTGTFYAQYETKIEAKIDGLSSGSTNYITLLKTASRHHGTPNGIFRWSGKSLDLIKVFLDAAPLAAAADMMRRMAQDFKSTKDGFPDLMLIKDGQLRFTEIKASGDVIRRNQLSRIKQLRAAGFKTDIARINWVVDPEQVYVVVDVETTGGRAGAHRMTEIGAVKIQNGKVIDEFQSLLNPERSIPPFITKLTGITQDMVKDAPLFADIAESFFDFMGDAIFAAHNVNFDYGFIRAEYERIGQSFKRPKICTCASMRKHYPGYRSYSLKNLCREFHINLESHHRALCDAKAAAELLFLVNDKRLRETSYPAATG